MFLVPAQCSLAHPSLPPSSSSFLTTVAVLASSAPNMSEDHNALLSRISLLAGTIPCFLLGSRSHHFHPQGKSTVTRTSRTIAQGLPSPLTRIAAPSPVRSLDPDRSSPPNFRLHQIVHAAADIRIGTRGGRPAVGARPCPSLTVIRRLSSTTPRPVAARRLCLDYQSPARHMAQWGVQPQLQLLLAMDGWRNAIDICS